MTVSISKKAAADNAIANIATGKDALSKLVKASKASAFTLASKVNTSKQALETLFGKFAAQAAKQKLSRIDAGRLVAAALGLKSMAPTKECSGPERAISNAWQKMARLAELPSTARAPKTASIKADGANDADDKVSTMTAADAERMALQMLDTVKGKFPEAYAAVISVVMIRENLQRKPLTKARAAMAKLAAVA